MIIADESQRMTANVHARGEVFSSPALYAGRGKFQKKGPIKKNWDQICDQCKLQGHVMEDCYKLNEYPADWKFKKKGFNHMQGTQMQMQKQNTMIKDVYDNKKVMYSDNDVGFANERQDT